MRHIFRASVYVILTMLVTGCSVFKHKKKTVPTTPTTSTSSSLGVPTIPGSFSALSKQGPKPYKEIITTKAKTQIGLFTVHKVEDKFYFEIPDSILGKEILTVTRFVKVPWGGGQYGGEEANNNVLKFEKGPDNKIFLRISLNVVSSPDSTKPIYEAVQNSSVNPIAVAFDIKAFGKDSASSIIEVTDFFKGDNQIVSIDPNLKRRFGLAGVATDRSYIETIKTFPINTEVRRILTFGASAGGPSPFGPALPSSNLPSAQVAGVVTLELNTSFLLLPATPMPKRMEDPRVGFFSDRLTVFTENSQKVDRETYITRWRLEPKDGDMEKYKRGELVEPKKQIVYYIDPATPKEWRPYLIAGINDWQKAFEQAGFKNAIVGKEWPEKDSTMSLEDARFSVLRYFASDIQNAYGPNVNDPRSGEILESHIGWYHNVMKLLHDWYFVQAAAIDPRARKMDFDSTLMGDLVRFVSSHEVGHTLGLRHNMGSSSRTPVEKLRDKKWVEANGHTASIMDYARFNYVAQPEDNIAPAGIYPRIGDYDKWAIQWGYKLSGAATPKEDKMITNKWAIDSLKNPRLWFLTYEGGNQADPRSQSEDLGDNAMKASDYGIKNLKRVVANLPEWTKEEADKYDNLEEMYGQVLGQYSRYMGHVVRNVGGVYETPKSIEQTGDVYEIVPKNLQKDAVSFLNRQLFATPTWLLDKNLLNKFANPITTESLQSVQTGVLNSLLSSARLGRMLSAENRFGATAYTADDMITDVKKGVFEELVSKKPIDAYRRNLQKSFVETLIGLLPTTTGGGGISIFSFSTGPVVDTKRSDIPSIARGQLIALQSEIKAAIPAMHDKMGKLHLLDISQRIKTALDPK